MPYEQGPAAVLAPEAVTGPEPTSSRQPTTGPEPVRGRGSATRREPAGGPTPVTTPEPVQRAPVTSPFRSASPELTRDRVRPMLSRFGITRIADVTGLDEIGLPTWVAYRPCGRTLSVSLGTGLDPVQAWVSAAMESIETWHAENDRLPIVARGAARDLGVGYDLRALKLAPRSPLTERTVLDWVAGRGLLTGADYLVPIDLVRLDFTRAMPWDDVLFHPSSNGLATGNTRPEATLHALLEIIERDSLAPYCTTPLGRRRYVDPDTARHPVAETVLAALRRAGCWVELVEATGRLGVPSYACAIWSPDLPLVCGGFGCHLDAGLAAGRAMAEAAQSRLAVVSGTRDDIDPDHYFTADPLANPGTRERALGPVTGSVRVDGDGVDATIRHCARLIMEITGMEPFVVDLTRTDIGIPASKVVAPGLDFYTVRQLSHRPGEHDA